MALPTVGRGGLLGLGLSLALLALAPVASAAYDCSSQNPKDWPPPAKPYFMIAFDTSGSMNDAVSPNPSCSGFPGTRNGHARCALSNMIKAYAGEVNFGLAVFPRNISKSGATNGPTTCPNSLGDGASNFNVNNCQLTNLFADTCGGTGTGTNARAANVLVELQQDDYWNTPPTSVNRVNELLGWVDNSCTDCKELFSSGYTPLNGLLRDMYRYLSTQWSAPSGTPTYATPLTGTERPCRSVNVILMTDGQEYCDPSRGNANGGAVEAGKAAAALLAGWNIGSIHWSAKTYVVAMDGDSAIVNDTNNIASNGGTTAAYLGTNETQLSTALSSIIAGAVTPEVCNNGDDNCNGCTDEGSKKFCNRNKTGRAITYLQTAANNPGADDCCNGVRATCLTNFAASISPSKPQGDRFWLPCWDPGTDNVNPETKWLCTDPAESCDDADNNCDTSITPASLTSNAVDEGFNKCPSCPVPETCDGKDQNCDGIIDNAAGSTQSYSVSAQCKPCFPSAEVCDGCDNDCDGDIDEGIAPLNCGFSPPAACLGTKTCTAHTAPGVGGYIASQGLPSDYCFTAGGAFSACSATGGAETCNALDDDCDGVVDDNPTDEGGNCTPNPGDPTVGACVPGKETCQNGALECLGYVGPGTEICDGIDNDCDGLTDAADPDLQGDGQPCGSTIGKCTKGTTACVGGALVCTGGSQPVLEVCNGLDDDCNGSADDGILDDAPTDPGCWSNPVAGTCGLTCSHGGLSWCPPAGATCTGLGTLTGTCAAGRLSCEGVAGWACKDDQGPSTEDCNLADDDCDGEIDEVADLGAPIGEVCGATVPDSPCLAGVWQCVAGTRVCSGVLAQPETCNGVDDDCDGTKDNGIAVGSSCWQDPARTKGECEPGVLQCDSNGGQTCVGGKGPSPEICDGLDNDCDGETDESGAPPEGVDGTADPNDPTRHLGDECGLAQGECEPGHLGCQGGRVECLDSVATGVEKCDCKDNDCDGQTDEIGGPTDQPLCSAGSICVQVGPGNCQCAAPCGSGEFPCPGGQTCNQAATTSGTSTSAGGVCVRPDACGDCTKKTVTRSDGTIECAPAGSQQASNRLIPVCECQGQSGCHDPCADKTCLAGQACSPVTLTCQDEDNCFFFGCPAGELCSANRVCVTDPCASNPCAADEACKPTDDFSLSRCVGSCADKTCAVGEACVEGECQPTGCGVDCPAGQFCLESTGDAGTAICGPSRCTSACQGGEYCDPRTGRCGASPCAGVACPAGQACSAGECVHPPAPTTPDGGGGGAPSAGGAPGTGARDGGKPTPGSGGATSGPATPTKAAFGLATGGGGCSCSIPASGRMPAPVGALAGLAAALALGARRRRRAVRCVGGAP